MENNSTTIKWGIIGCGDVCEVKSGPAFNKVDNSELIAVMRRDLEKAKDYAARHHVPQYYSDAEAIIHHPEVNAVYIATPPAYHEAYTLAAIKAGKFVYIEKPVALNGDACTRMIEADKQHNGKTVVAHYRRELPLFKKIKEIIRANEIGAVRLVSLRFLQSPANNIIAKAEENWRVNAALSGGGLFHDLAPHQLDILIWLLGAPLNVRGHSLQQVDKQGVPDVVTLESTFNNAVAFQGLWSFNVCEQAVEDSCLIVGERGTLRFSFFRNPTLTIVTASGERAIAFEIPTHIQQPMIAKTVDYFRGHGDNPCSLEDALISMKMMDSTLL